MKTKVEIIPSEYKGWSLYFSPSHDNQSNFRADKNQSTCFAPTPDELIRKIEEQENLTFKFKKPIQGFEKDDYTKKWKPIAITSIVGKMVYHIIDGIEKASYLSDFEIKPDAQTRRLIIKKTKDNSYKIKQIEALEKQIANLSSKKRSMMQRLLRLTDADILHAAKNNE